MPKVSVVMSVKNGEPYIAQSIHSVLNQTFVDFEFIIVNDGSTDNTSRNVRSFNDSRIILLEQENTGVAKAKNKAIAQSRGTYIAIIDADDLWAPDKLQKQVDFLDNNPNYVLVGGWVDNIDKDSNYLYTFNTPSTDQDVRAVQEKFNPWIHSSVLFTKKMFNAIGGYYEPIKQYLVDYILLYQLSLQGKVCNLNSVVAAYRIVPTALSTKQNAPEFDALAKKAIVNGALSENDQKRLLDLKKGEEKSSKYGESMYHLYLGRSYLFHNFNRTKSKASLKQALELWPDLKIAKAYYAMALLLPQFVIKLVYGFLGKRNTSYRKEQENVWTGISTDVSA
jgi:glycosyltransferase involved in cell wall biosynthesis